jgi:hypothetical protein
VKKRHAVSWTGHVRRPACVLLRPQGAGLRSRRSALGRSRHERRSAGTTPQGRGAARPFRPGRAAPPSRNRPGASRSTPTSRPSRWTKRVSRTSIAARCASSRDRDRVPQRRGRRPPEGGGMQRRGADRPLRPAFVEEMVARAPRIHAGPAQPRPRPARGRPAHAVRQRLLPAERLGSRPRQAARAISRPTRSSSSSRSISTASISRAATRWSRSTCIPASATSIASTRS